MCLAGTGKIVRFGMPHRCGNKFLTVKYVVLNLLPQCFDYAVYVIQAHSIWINRLTGLLDFAGARGLYEVFISHAGTVKEFACNIANELKRLGFRTFVDADELKPGDDADAKMVKAAENSPIGLVLFDSDFFTRKWPMRELGIIVKSDTLLPVLVGPSYSQAEDALRMSALGEAPFGERFVQKVLRTTFGVSKGLRHGELLQRVCLDVTRVFILRVCSALPNVLRSAGHFHQALTAARMLREKRSFGLLRKDDCEEIDRWIKDLEAKLDIS